MSLLHPRRRVLPMTASSPPPSLGLVQRRTSAAAKSEALQAMQRFVRVDYWNGMAAGDVVRVSGQSSRGRHWRFRAHVTNTSNGAAWVEVALVEGPPPSKRPLPLSSRGAPGDPGHGLAEDAPRVDKVRSFDPA